MKTALLAVSGILLVLTLAHAGPIPPGPSAAYINNSASAQTAQFNVGTGTVRGTLTVKTLSTLSLSLTTATATQFIGGGASLTSLSPANVATGTIPAGVVWHGAAVPVAYGGTGADLSAVTQGKIPYFSSTGAIGTIAAGTSGQVLQSSGSAGIPSFTSAPSITGANLTAVPLASLLPGTLSASVVASSITNTAVTPGVYGGPAQIPQLTIGLDGRVTSASQSALTTGSALLDEENYYSHFNKFLSSVTVVGALYAPGANITGIIYSTSVLQVQINSIATDTGTLTTNLSAEVVRALAAEAAIKVSTGINTLAIATEIVTRSTSDAAIALSTGINTLAIAAEVVARSTTDAAIILSTGVFSTGLAAELVTRSLADAAIGVTTGTIQSSLSAVILSTGVIAASDILKLPLAGGTLTGLLHTSSQTVVGEIIVSTSTTSSDALCFAGAVTALPTTGYNRGCLVYLNSAPASIFLSTEVVVSTRSWLAK